MKYIGKCPKCGLNYITEGEEFCDVCTNEKIKETQEHKQRPNVYFDEIFTFTNKKVWCRNHYGYEAYNSQKVLVGVVFMTDDKRTPAYGNCELCFYPEFEKRYGVWHRFKSNGYRLPWKTLCERLKNERSCSYFIDE